MSRWFALLPVFAALAGPAAAQLPPDKGLAALKAADGLQVELFASEPMLINPTSIDIDPAGRVWVAEAVNYRRKMFNRPMLRPEGDRIVVLTDKDGDGKADDSTVFYQGTDLYGPLSVCVLPQADGKALRVLVAQSPDILEFWDKDGDLKADGPPKKFLTGFGGFDHDHGVHGLVAGPDGKIYFTVGDSGVTGLQSSDGKGPKFKSNTTDCRAGTVWRCDMDGTNLELIAHNFRNNYEACVNSFGEIWLSDNDDDGNQQTRICHVMPGGNYGYNPRGPGQSHWHEEQPGIVHKTLRTGFGSPTGITFYEGDLLPPVLRGNLLHCDAGPRELRAFQLQVKGAGYELAKLNLLTSSDTWFRPSDVCVAPDGSVFIADWYDPGVGGHGMGDWTRGRIYRLTPKGHAGYKIPPVKLGDPEGILAALGSPCQSTRALAINKINSMDVKEAIGVLAKGEQVGNPFQVTRITWHLGRLLHTLPEIDRPKSGAKSFLTLLQRADMVRGWMMPLWQAYISRLMNDVVGYSLLDKQPDGPDEPMKGEIASLREDLLRMKSRSPDSAKPWFYRYAKRYDGKDIFYRAALNIACGTDPARRDAILADFDKHFPEWNDTVADLVWELRPKSVLPRLEKLVSDSKLTAAQRARIVDILAASDDVDAGKAVLTLLASDAPAEVKARALDNLRLFLPTKWNPLTKGDAVKAAFDALAGDAKTRPTALQLAAAANLAPAVDAIEALAADAKQPADLRTDAMKALASIKTEKAVDALMRLGQPENPLSVEVVKALGQHLPTGQKPTEANKRAFDALQMAITLEKASAPLKAAALNALAGSRPGTDYLLALKEKGEMPAEIVADAGKLLRNSPFQGQRNKALLLFPAPGKLDPKKLPSPAVLAKRTGNAEAGKQIAMKSLTSEVQCLKCHMVRGQGGQIGPDLSMIGKKASKENLYESILNPSKAIADQYVSVTVNTVDGQTITGLVAGETETTLTLRDANGKDYPIALKDVDSRKKSLVSLMPDNLAAALTEDELVDLVEYFTTLQTPSLTPDVWHLAGPFPAATMIEGLAKEYGPEKAAFDVKASFPANGKDIAWRTVRPGGSGYLDLAAFHGNAGANSATYLAQTIDSPADQDATVLLGTDDGAKLWVNGEQVFQTDASRAAAPEQESVKVKLKKGPNAVLLKVANGNNPHGAFVTVLSSQELKAGR